VLVGIAVFLSGGGAGNMRVPFSFVNPLTQTAGCFIGICWSDGSQAFANPSGSMTLDGSTITAGQSTTLRWSFFVSVPHIYDTNGVDWGYCRGWNGAGGTPSAGSFTVSPSVTTTYYANYASTPPGSTCNAGSHTGEKGPVTSVTLTVIQPPPPSPTIDYFYTSTPVVPYNGGATLYWSSSNTDSCYIYNGPGTGYVAVSGGEWTPALTSAQNYYIECHSPYTGAWVNAGPVSIGITYPAPTLALTVNGQAGSFSVAAGTPLNVQSTYAAGGDTIVATQLNELPPASSETAINNSAPVTQTSRAYSFTPTTPGTYIFKPYIATTGYTNGGWYSPSANWVTVTVAASIAVPPPQDTISAGAGNGVPVTVVAGTPVTISATYTADAADTLTQTAIDGPNSTNSVPGVPFTAPFSPKQ
jgi:hypothetical protein